MCREKNIKIMAIVKVDEARQGLAGDSAEKGETNVDERGDDRGG
jgi:hypothetical protein